MNRASIVVDRRHIRCSNCRVALHDDLAMACPVCRAEFDSITSNHVGMANGLERRRVAAGVSQTHACISEPADEATELVGS
jgi:hypothetical protein